LRLRLLLLLLLLLTRLLIRRLTLARLLTRIGRGSGGCLGPGDPDRSCTRT
jgi:hypothetical protein